VACFLRGIKKAFNLERGEARVSFPEKKFKEWLDARSEGYWKTVFGGNGGIEEAARWGYEQGVKDVKRACKVLECGLK
jgi:hypothetical protein